MAQRIRLSLQFLPMRREQAPAPSMLRRHRMVNPKIERVQKKNRIVGRTLSDREQQRCGGPVLDTLSLLTQLNQLATDALPLVTWQNCHRCQ